MIQMPKKDFWGADIAFVFLIWPKGKSSCSGATYPQNHRYLEGPWMGTAAGQPGQEIQSIGRHPPGGNCSREVPTHYLVKPREDQANAKDGKDSQKKGGGKVSRTILSLSIIIVVNVPPWWPCARLGNPFKILRNSAIIPTSDLLDSGIFIGILFFRS